MKTMQMTKWMIEVGEIMNRWYSAENRQSKLAEKRTINSVDLYIPKSFWILKVIHEQSEKYKPACRQAGMKG